MGSVHSPVLTAKASRVPPYRSRMVRDTADMRRRIMGPYPPKRQVEKRSPSGRQAAITSWAGWGRCSRGKDDSGGGRGAMGGGGLCWAAAMVPPGREVCVRAGAGAGVEGGGGGKGRAERVPVMGVRGKA